MHIDWHQSKPNGDQRQQNPATIAVHHLSMIDLAVPSLDTTINQEDPYISVSAELELTQLRIIPQFMDTQSPPQPPLLVAIFTPMSALSDGDDMRRAPYSILSRWEVREEKPEIDTIFSQIGSKRLHSDNLKVQTMQARLFFCLRLAGRACSETARGY